MKRPTWALVIGILGIVFGSFGIFGGARMLVMPAVMHLEKDMFSNMQKTLENQGDAGSAEGIPPADALKFAQKLWQVPSWFGAYCVVTGIIGVLLAGFLILASIWLILVKPYAIKMFYLATGLSIAFVIVRSAIALSALSSFVLMSMMVGGLFWIVINAVLMIAVATNNKDAFRAQTVEQGTAGIHG